MSAGALAQLAALTSTTTGVREVALDRLYPDPDQPRQVVDDGDALAELAATIAVFGVLQPLLVQPPDSDGNYQIIAGERRWRAASSLPPEKRPTAVPIRILDLAAADVPTVQLIENLQRQDLTEMEIATSLYHQREVLGRTPTEIANSLGKPFSWVSRHLALLNIGDSARQALESHLVHGADSVLTFDTLPEDLQTDLLSRTTPIPRAELRSLSESHTPAPTATPRRGRPRTPKPEAPKAPIVASPSSKSSSPLVAIELPDAIVDRLCERLGLKRPKDNRTLSARLIERLSE